MPMKLPAQLPAGTELATLDEPPTEAQVPEDGADRKLSIRRKAYLGRGSCAPIT